MWTFSKMWEVTTPQEAKDMIERQSSHIDEPQNLEEQAIKLVGTDIYKKLIKGYTKKQWRKDPKELPAAIIKRLPVRFTYDGNYFNDKYQGIPIGGYTQIFEKLLDGIEVKLGVDYLEMQNWWDTQAKKIIYTGPIDRFFNYKFGELEYKTTKFEHKHLPIENYQGVPFMSFTDEETPYTRVIEHKHFENTNTQSTWISWEFPVPYKPNETEPYYPVNDTVNNEIYQKYKVEANQLPNILFGGRLAEYKYYDMHQVIESALNFIKKEI
jgi:UDP-galactopyranose mutase